MAICEGCREHTTSQRQLVEAIRAFRSRHPESAHRARVQNALRQARFDTRVR
jgi:hypothetical protein